MSFTPLGSDRPFYKLITTGPLAILNSIASINAMRYARSNSINSDSSLPWMTIAGSSLIATPSLVESEWPLTVTVPDKSCSQAYLFTGTEYFISALSETTDRKTFASW